MWFFMQIKFIDDKILNVKCTSESDESINIIIRVIPLHFRSTYYEMSQYYKKKIKKIKCVKTI